MDQMPRRSLRTAAAAMKPKEPEEDSDFEDLPVEIKHGKKTHVVAAIPPVAAPVSKTRMKSEP